MVCVTNKELVYVIIDLPTNKENTATGCQVYISFYRELLASKKLFLVGNTGQKKKKKLY